MFIRDEGIIIHLSDENGWKYIKTFFRPVINDQNNGARVNERVLRIVVLLKTHIQSSFYGDDRRWRKKAFV